MGKMLETSANQRPTRRGRPAGLMTHRRRQVFAEIQEAAKRGEKITLASLARRIGLYDYRDARRIVRELRAMGAV